SSGLLLALEVVDVVVNGVEHAFPDRTLAVDPAARLGESAGLEAEPVSAALDRAHHHAFLHEHLHVPGNRWLRYPEAARCLADRRRTAGQSFHNPPPDRVSQRPERIVSHNANYNQAPNATGAPCTAGQVGRQAG